ncbi:hypothetical protein ABVT39_009410 [Epinephelus coioides]
MAIRRENAETHISSLEDKQSTDKKAADECYSEVKTSRGKVSHLESQSRRNNVIIACVKEGLLESGNPEEELSAILRYILDRDDMDPVPEVDRHHRSLRPHTGPEEPLRLYIVRLL